MTVQSEVSKRKEQELGRLRRDCEEELRQRDANLETVKSKHLQSMQEQEERLHAQARECHKVEQEKQAMQEENNELKLVADNAARERANNDKGGFKAIVVQCEFTSRLFFSNIAGWKFVGHSFHWSFPFPIYIFEE